MTSISDINLDWLGGIFDASGSIVITTNKCRKYTTYYLQLRISGFSEEFLMTIRDHIRYGSVQPHGDHTYYVAAKSAYNLACLLVDHTYLKKTKLQYAILYYLEMNRLGKQLRAASRYNPEEVPKLRKAQDITHLYFKEKFIDR